MYCTYKLNSLHFNYTIVHNNNYSTLLSLPCVTCTFTFTSRRIGLLLHLCLTTRTFPASPAALRLRKMEGVVRCKALLSNLAGKRFPSLRCGSGQRSELHADDACSSTGFGTRKFKLGGGSITAPGMTSVSGAHGAMFSEDINTTNNIN